MPEVSIAGEISTIDGFLKIVSEQYASNPTDRYYFRGEAKCFDSVLPSLLRDKVYNKLKTVYGKETPIDLQIAILERFQRLTSQYQYEAAITHPRGFFEWICIAQHHTVPTLLLDWSLNPLTALFFAIDDPCCEHNEQDGRVWVMKLRPKTERQKFSIYVGNERVSSGLEERQESAPVTNWMHTGRPLVIIPRILTRRIEAQAGRFILTDRPLLDITKDSPTVPWEEVDCYRLPWKQKQKIRDELRVLRVHEGTMYADLDNYGRYLKSAGL